MKFKKSIIAVSATLLSSFALAGGTCDNSNLSAWSVTNNPDNKLNVTGGSAMGGTTCGLDLEVKIQNGGQADKHFVQDASPNQESRYRAAFCFDPNSLPMATSNANRRVKIHQAQCTSCDNSDVVQFKAQRAAVGDYELNLFVRQDNGGSAAANKSQHVVSIPDAPTRIEYDVDLTAGTFKVWVNATSEGDTPVVDVTGLDTSVKWPFITRARLGSMDKSANAGVGSTFYIDEFESRRQTFIGGTCN